MPKKPEVPSRYPKEFGGLPSVTEVLERVQEEGLIEWYKRTNQFIINSVSEKAKEIGTLCNTLIDAHDKNEVLTVESPYFEEISKAVGNYMAWRKLNNYKTMGSQIQVIHKELGYVGTIDRLLEGKEGLVIVDWKASKKIRLKNKLQVIAYKKAWEHLNKEKIAACCLVRLDKEDISFDPNRDVVWVKDEGDKMFECFVNLLRFHREYKLLEEQEN